MFCMARTSPGLIVLIPWCRAEMNDLTTVDLFEKLHRYMRLRTRVWAIMCLVPISSSCSRSNLAVARPVLMLLCYIWRVLALSIRLRIRSCLVRAGVLLIWCRVSRICVISLLNVNGPMTQLLLLVARFCMWLVAVAWVARNSIGVW